MKTSNWMLEVWFCWTEALSYCDGMTDDLHPHVLTQFDIWGHFFKDIILPPHSLQSGLDSYLHLYKDPRCSLKSIKAIHNAARTQKDRIKENQLYLVAYLHYKKLYLVAYLLAMEVQKQLFVLPWSSCSCSQLNWWTMATKLTGREQKKNLLLS